MKIGRAERKERGGRETRSVHGCFTHSLLPALRRSGSSKMLQSGPGEIQFEAFISALGAAITGGCCHLLAFALLGNAQCPQEAQSREDKAKESRVSRTQHGTQGVFSLQSSFLYGSPQAHPRRRLLNALGELVQEPRGSSVDKCFPLVVIIA